MDDGSRRGGEETHREEERRTEGREAHSEGEAKRKRKNKIAKNDLTSPKPFDFGPLFARQNLQFVLQFVLLDTPSFPGPSPYFTFFLLPFSLNCGRGREE